MESPEKLKQKPKLTEEISRFLDQWHRFFIDWWWRDKYKVPFGSVLHREQNFIDMAVEYLEEVRIKQIRATIKKHEEEELYVHSPNDERTVKMTKQEIADEYDNLDLTQFDKKDE